MNWLLIEFCIIANIFLRILAFPRLEDCQILDLTHDFSSEHTIYWGGIEKFKHPVVFQGFTKPGNYYYEAFKQGGPEHGGTHLDAPVHFSKSGQSSDKIPLEKLIGEACVVDVSNKVKSNKNYQMTADDLREWENINGPLSNRCIVVMRTGWEFKYKNITDYLGTDTPNDTKSYHFPGLSPNAAQWLIDSDRMKAFGIDTASVDHGQSADFKTHQILSSKNVSGFENLMNVHKLPARGATIIALPMKIKEGSGGPLRAMAIGWNGSADGCRRTVNLTEN